MSRQDVLHLNEGRAYILGGAYIRITGMFFVRRQIGLYPEGTKSREDYKRQFMVLQTSYVTAERQIKLRAVLKPSDGLKKRNSVFKSELDMVRTLKWNISINISGMLDGYSQLCLI